MLVQLTMLYHGTCIAKLHVANGHKLLHVPLVVLSVDDTYHSN